MHSNFRKFKSHLELEPCLCLSSPSWSKAAERLSYFLYYTPDWRTRRQGGSEVLNMALLYPQLKHRHMIEIPVDAHRSQNFWFESSSPFFPRPVFQPFPDNRGLPYHYWSRRAANFFGFQRNKSSNLSLFEKAYWKSVILKSESKSQSQICNQKRHFCFPFLVLFDLSFAIYNERVQA